MSVYKAISSVMGDLAKVGIAKSDTNTFDKYKYRGIDAVYNALAPLLAKHGLVVLPRVVDRHTEERTSAKGGTLIHTTLTVDFDLAAAEDGSTHTIRAIGEAMDRGDKSVNKAMTAAYKYAMFELFCIPTEGADDADADSHEVEHTGVLAQEWIDTIQGCTDSEALDAIGADIAKASLPASAKAKIRAAFAAQKHTLKVAA